MKLLLTRILKYNFIILIINIIIQYIPYYIEMSLIYNNYLKGNLLFNLIKV